MTEYYKVKICGLSRRLPLIPVSKNTRIASLNILGDTLLVSKVADNFAKRLKKIDFDYLVGPEVKVVPLLQEIATRLKRDRFVVCRKSVKPYMLSPTILKPLPYFPKHVRPLVIDGEDKIILKGKKVVIVDDVISTGVTHRMMKELLKRVGAQVVATYSIVKQGEEQFDEINNFYYLVRLPIFKSS